MSEVYILLCPVCCSTVDAEREEGAKQQKFECDACGQEWTMEIDSARQAQFSAA